jgi:imidazole glycerol phosphate synthase subunit HisF
MDLYFAFIPLVAIIAYLVLRNPSSTKPSKGERIDFIKQASDSIHGEEISVDERPALDSGGYEYEVVGESFQRENLLKLIRAHEAFDSGQIVAMAVLEPEPTNEFDSTAVKVVVEGVQVGYIAASDSGVVTAMIKKSGKKSFEVPVRIGFDPNSPSPLIGVRLALRLS